jgi:hypothetical protein
VEFFFVDPFLKACADFRKFENVNCPLDLLACTVTGVYAHIFTQKRRVQIVNKPRSIFLCFQIPLIQDSKVTTTYAR